MKSGRPVIYWDTCVFIAWLKDEKDKWPPAVWQGIQDVADLVQIGQAILVTSTLIRTEVFLGRLTLEQKQKFAGILRKKNVQEIAPHMRITDRASVIREKHKIKTPDAIHLATAILYDVDEMQTMDGWHEDGKRDGLLALSGNVAEYKLSITQPYPRVTPPTPTATPPEPVKGEQEFLWKDLLEEELESEGDEQNGTAEESNELKADPAHPAPVQGSDDGRAEGETTKETSEIAKHENKE
jgi:predicted nucleic acid-binding protein